MGNEKVSQLIELLATDLAYDDVLLITDTSQKESKKIETGQLLLFIENSGSFFAYDALHANTASYITSSGVIGNVLSATSASYALSSSWSDNSKSSSHSISSSTSNTSSYSLTCVTHTTNADTASYLQYSGFINGTASCALTSALAISALNSYNLLYSGQPNGTASWAISASNANTASYVSPLLILNTASYALSSSNADSASYLIGGFVQPVKAWASVTWSVAGRAYPQVYQSNNINSIKWLGTDFTRPATGHTFTYDTVWIQYGVTFTTPLNSSNYMLMGNCYQPYAYNKGSGNKGTSPQAFVVLHPVYSQQTTTKFTMSIGIPYGSALDTDLPDYLTQQPGLYPDGIYPYMNFQILG